MLYHFFEFLLWESFTKYRHIVERIANLFLYASAIVISVSPEIAKDAWWSFVGFAIGHVILAMSAWVIKEKRWLELNVFFLILDIYAVIVRLPIDWETLV